MSETVIKNITQETVVKFPVSLPGATGPAGVGVPVGGTVGQVLTKASNTDYDTEWVTISGGGGSDATITKVAGEAMSAGRVVIIEADEAFYFQPSDATHHGRAFGVTTTSATLGGNVTIQSYGFVIDGSFGFAADTVLWVTADGEIVNTQPSTTIVQKAGVAYDEFRMLIDFSVSIKTS